ncbi:MAG: 23S rRNA (uracil(1939)-C(5))-methyltransferase RlmD [Clostridia bacterium]|nr:23S rRNA (uracil(1939)-C(5))-methyltransferase RlmD [Clostridia bacterium]
MLSVGQDYQVTIKDTNIFGNGFCIVDNTVVFVENALKDEICNIKITDIESNHAYAKITSIVKPSCERVTPDCKCYKDCGGCNFLHTSLNLENQVKEQYVKHALQSQGIEASVEKIQCYNSEKYRNKVVLFYNGSNFGYMKSTSNEIVPHEECLLNEDVFDQIAKETAKLLKGTSLRALFMRKSSDAVPEIMVCPILRGNDNLKEYTNQIVKSFPQIKTVLYSVCDESNLLFERLTFKTIYGEGVIYDTICGLKFRISPESFYQINHTCAEKLYEKAIELAQLKKNSICADLFCGTGTIGIVSAKKSGATIYGVEIVKKAVEDAKYNATLNQVENIYFEAKDASKFNKKIDVAIIDPPRKGCSRLMLYTLLRLRPQKIVYISCNVTTQARDLKALSKHYVISSPVYPFNLFPRTSHVESVVCLTRTFDN